MVLTEKYKKLKQHLSKVLKKRHIPNIKIQTTNNKRCDSTYRCFTDLSSTKGVSTSDKVHIYRSNSLSKNVKINKPPFFPEKVKNIKKNSEEISNHENIYQNNPYKKLSGSIIKPRVIEEIAVVSSSSLLSEIKIQNICSNFMKDANFYKSS